MMDRSDFERAQQLIQRIAPVEFLRIGKTIQSGVGPMPSDTDDTTKEPKAIVIQETSRPAQLATVIKEQLKEEGKATLHARGMQAINQAVKAIAVARRNWLDRASPDMDWDEETHHGDKAEDLIAFVRMLPREELTWACTLDVVPFTPEPEPPLQLGEIIEYNSSTHGVWIPAEVLSLNDDGTVDLNIREEASTSRIRRLMEEIRVARTSEPDLVAKTIAGKLRLGHPLMLAAIGPSSVHSAVLGIALGSLYLQDQDGQTEIGFRPEFSTVEMGSTPKLVTMRLILDAASRKSTQSPQPLL